MKRGGGGGFTVSRTRSLVQGASGGRGRVRWATSVRRPTRDLDLPRPPFLASSPLRCRPVHSTPREERTGEPSSPIPPSGSSTHQPSTTRTLTRSRLRCVVSFFLFQPGGEGGPTTFNPFLHPGSGWNPVTQNSFLLKTHGHGTPLCDPPSSERSERDRDPRAV